jgi:hypothetical protein
MVMVHHERESRGNGVPRESLIDKERKQKRTKALANNAQNFGDNNSGIGAYGLS